MNEEQLEGQEEEDAVFDLFDEIFGSLDSFAWGLGSSADLHLPDLSSPQDDYTVIAMVQIGEGEDATLMAALDEKVAEPNPEPPVMMNMSLSFGQLIHCQEMLYKSRPSTIKQSNPLRDFQRF